jgi:hypothetical protein
MGATINAGDLGGFRFIRDLCPLQNNVVIVSNGEGHH